MDDLEKTLRRYRPAGPPSELRDRIVSMARRPDLPPSREASADCCSPGGGDPVERLPTTGRRRLRDWLPSLAAAAAIFLFYALASNERAEIGALTAADAEAREAMVNEVSAALGGDAFARAEAERLVVLNEEEAARLEAVRNPSPVQELLVQ